MTDTIVTRVDEASYNFGNPVDCLTAYTTKLSLAHLITESTQVRINWVGVTPGNFSTFFGNAAARVVFAQVYPHTWLSATQIANVDLYVACRVSGGSGQPINVRARIVPSHFAVGNLTCPALVDVTGTTSATSATYVINEQQLIPSIVTQFFASSFDGTFGAEPEDGVASIAVQSMMRLEISVDTSDDIAEIVAVYLREYATGEAAEALPTAFPSLTWTGRRAADTVIWNGVLRVEALGLYIAYGYDTADNNGIVSTSTDDGVTWTDRQPTEVAAHQWYGMTYETSTGRLVAVGQNIFSGSPVPTGKCITSTDSGVTWTAHNILSGELSTSLGGGSGDSPHWQSVLALPGGRLVASAGVAKVTDGQHYVATSDDGGSTWTGRSMPSPYNSGSTFWGQLAANADGTKLVMLNNDTGADAALSTDYGHTWTITALPFTSSDATWGGDVTYGDTAGFVAIGAENTIGYDKVWSSTAGAAWSLEVEAGAVFSSYFVEWIAAAVPFYLIGGVASPTGTFLRASFDGSTWYDSADPDPGDGISQWMGAAYSSDLTRIAMVNADGVIVTGDFA